MVYPNSWENIGPAAVGISSWRGELTSHHYPAATLQGLGKCSSFIHQIPRAIRSSRNGKGLSLAQDLFVSLIVAKKENLVFLYRAAESSTKLILLEISPSSSSEEVGGVEIGIAEKVERVSVKLIGSGFGDDIDLAAAEVSIFRVEIVGNDAKL